jgi:hypothetical protein
MNAYKYKNFIKGDPILDLLKIKGYKMDNELPGFDEDLLLENYTRNNKILFCSKIFEKLGRDAIKIAPDAFVMKSRKLKYHFNNYSTDHEGLDYSLFTIEYSTITTLKNGNISQIHKYYNFKNWLHTLECRYKIDNSFVLGRKYKDYNSFNFLAKCPYTFEDLLKSGDKHLSTIRDKVIGVDIFPNMKNTSDYPFHNAKKIINRLHEKEPIIEDTLPFVNEKKLPLNIKEDDNVFFIDFEILTNVYDNFSTFPTSNTKNHLFNIGCCSEKDELSLVSRDIHSEGKILQDFVDYLNRVEGSGKIVLIHWTGIEKRIFEEKMKEYPSVYLKKQIKWVDLHDYFIKSKVYVKGAQNRKLKTIVRHMNASGLIKTNWENGVFFDGLGAMTGFIKYLKTSDEEILSNIAKYNMIDCIVMMEIYKVIVNDLNVPDC